MARAVLARKTDLPANFLILTSLFLLSDLPDVDELGEIRQEIAGGVEQHERDQVLCSGPHHAE